MLVDAVRRRLIEATCSDVIEQAVPLRIFSRDTIVDGLLLCGGSVAEFNTHYNAWRKARAREVIVVHYGPADGDVRCPEEPHFLDFVRGRSAPVPVLDPQASAHELLERSIEVQVVLSKFPWHLFDHGCAAQCLFVCDGQLAACCKILERLLPTLEAGGAPPSARWLVWNVSRLYCDPWASLREDWRAPAEVRDAARA